MSYLFLFIALLGILPEIKNIYYWKYLLSEPLICF